MRFTFEVRLPAAIAFALTIGSLLLSLSPVHAETFRVPGEFPTIQEAIDTCEHGDSVLVAAGTYRGEGNRNLRLRGIALILVSEEGPLQTRLDCENSGFGILITRTARDEATIEGFSIDSADNGGIICISSEPVIVNCRIFRCRPAGIVLNDASPTIAACDIIGNESAGSGAGIYCYSQSDPFIAGCLITGNRASGEGGGIYCSTSSPMIIGTTITANQAAEGGGVSCRSNSNPTFTQSILWGNCAASGREAHGGFACTMVFTCCDLDQTGIVGVKVLDGRQVQSDPLFCGPVDCAQAPTISGDYTLTGDSPCLIDVSPCGELIGGADQGCPGTATATISWGAVKLLFGR